ncbi:hypothetical protein ACH427_27425 [Streptomyces sp. NPDC020379]|uniref:hypothetical protein n=1 Tax=Streptomyces sp. NPDC020379 TaxID=3365071 RepID=UPI0037B65485
MTGFGIGWDDLTRRTRWGLLGSSMYVQGPYEKVLVAALLLAWISQYDEAGFEAPAADGDPARSARNILMCQQIMENPDPPVGDGDPYLTV